MMQIRPNVRDTAVLARRSAPGVWALSALALAALIVMLAPASQAHAQQRVFVGSCGALENAYGPWNYTDPVHYKEKLPIVEKIHFFRAIEQLDPSKVDGMATGVGRNIDYVLRAFPNHHRGLDAMGRWHVQTGLAKPPGSRYSVDCWFERAMKFQPADGMVRMLYGIYKARLGQNEEALEYYSHAEALMPESSELHYNLGLLLTNLDRHEDALPHAQRAYAMGFPLPGLKRRLIKSGHWVEPPPEPEAAPETASE